MQTMGGKWHDKFNSLWPKIHSVGNMYSISCNRSLAFTQGDMTYDWNRVTHKYLKIFHIYIW